MAVDTTNPTDAALVSSLPGYIRDLAIQINANEDAIGGDYSRSIDAQNVDVTLTVAELNQVYTVNDPAAVTIELPEVTGDNAGTWIRVHKLGAGDVVITPGGTDAIADGGAGVSISDVVAGEAKSAFIELECIGAGQWMISGILGTWS